MDANAILNVLKYKGSPCFLEGSRLNEYPSYSHIFRRAQKFCNLQGVYTLKEQTDSNSTNKSIIPLVYVCEADTKDAANEIHKLVWNQNIVPFLLVVTPNDFRLYRGFEYDTQATGRGGFAQDQSVLRAVKDANDILSKFKDFKADSIDNGDIFKNWSKDITANTRVDWKLLDSLKKLSEQLINDVPKLHRNIAHTVIGKYVYLRYLRDRNILSDRKLDEWGIKYENVFGRSATLSGLYSIEEKLDTWLNGSVFPLPVKEAFKEKHIRKVASTFKGDDPGSRQMHLDFDAYNFQHIPIETLSVVYEQFLHAEGQGREKGAYYTPIHLVNFILDELDAKRPLKKGMKVFDASCGSGAFLVQCYRRLIERELAGNVEERPRPAKLRELLTEHIYGLDADEDACGVTELSLILTLLDYVEPPDLESYYNFKLPKLHNRNIFFCDTGFFDLNSKWEQSKSKDGYDWIVGNPPWKEINAEKIDKSILADQIALKWIRQNKAEFPISGNQIAEAFAWRVTQSLSDKGLVGLLLPAATLFKKSAGKFRTNFFAKTKTWCVVNFANLRHLLFRNATKPAAAFFYSQSKCNEVTEQTNIITYAPFAVDQVNCYAKGSRAKDELWTIIINDCGIKEIPNSEATSGSSLPWKLAMWGTVRDKHLLECIRKRFVPLSTFITNHKLRISEGLQLREYPSEKSVNYRVVDRIKEVIGKKELIMANLRGCDKIHFFPARVFEKVESSRAYVRKGRGKTPLQICYPPHIITDAARKFSVYSNKFIVVPPRQIGIAGDESNLLKALSLYLSSDFAFYHQFLTSESSFGVERDVTNKEDLLKLPIPFENLSTDQISAWADLHDKIVKAEKEQKRTAGQLFVKTSNKAHTLKSLLNRMNKDVYNLLKITDSEQDLINDFLQTRMKLNEGAIAREAVKSATKSEMLSYATVMKNELDDFLSKPDKHQIKIYFSDESAMIEIVNLKHPSSSQPEIIDVNTQTQIEFEKLHKNLSKEQSQWIYFNKCLKIFEDRSRTTYIFKPRHRLYWLKSQAFVDAGEFIADKLTVSQGE
jgi:type I restriction-modification system DNA methylase subunit